MKWALFCVALFGAWAALGSSGISSGADAVLVIGGDTDGYLSPCGCTKPMSGGIRRRIALMKQLAVGRNAALLETGGLIKGIGAQDQLKAEAIAEALAKAKFDAVQVGFAESRLGLGGVTSILNLLGNRGLASTIGEGGRLGLNTVVVKEPFAIGAIDSRSDALATNLGEPRRSQAAAIDEVLALSRSSGLIPILMFQGTLDQTKRLPRVGEFALVTYRSSGAPNDAPVQVGSAVFVSPGEKGKAVLTASFRDGRFSGYATYKLPPDVADDHETHRIFLSYLNRVSSEGLLVKLPRSSTGKFSGNAKCGSCHSKALAAWKKSEHAGALKTLEMEKHDKDPDCVGCHVVGLDLKFGFKSRGTTPQLANVGCESCHGPGAAHSAWPKKVKMMKVGVKSCAKCHVPDHSPGFNFAEYWAKIKH